MPSKRTSSRPEWVRAAVTVRVRVLLSRDVTNNTEPTAKRSSGRSVLTSTSSSPRMPCGLATRPTLRTASEPRVAIGCPVRSAIGVHHVHPQAATTDAGHHGAQGGRGAAAAPDHLAQVLRVHVHFEGPTPTC